MNRKKAVSPGADIPNPKGVKRCLVGSLLFILAAGQTWAVTVSARVYEREAFGNIKAEVLRNSEGGTAYLPLGGPISMALYFGLALWMFLFWRDRTFSAPPRFLVWGEFVLAAWAMYKLFSVASLAGIGAQNSGLSVTFAGFVGAVGVAVLLTGALAYRGARSG
ncbi:MAG: hypothetical protein ABL962_03645 [Fimbriimonadaceae bacterium]